MLNYQRVSNLEYSNFDPFIPQRKMYHKRAARHPENMEHGLPIAGLDPGLSSVKQ